MPYTSEFFKFVDGTGLNRLLVCLAIGLVMLALSIWMALNEYHPRAQIMFWRVGCFAVGCWVGYWAHRGAVRMRITDDSHALDRLGRVLMMIAGAWILSQGQ